MAETMIEAGAKAARAQFATPDSTWTEIVAAALLAMSSAPLDERVVEEVAKELIPDAWDAVEGVDLYDHQITDLKRRARNAARATIVTFLRVMGEP